MRAVQSIKLMHTQKEKMVRNIGKVIVSKNEKRDNTNDTKAAEYLINNGFRMLSLVQRPTNRLITTDIIR
ncbi:hypothetical protein FACS1894170_09630 [Planctomycetales bacterium]|nr:hypothetical protein FACS1894170_09630 [Planctomycetales bacterium]